MMATVSNRAQAVAALKLQRERSTTYQQWMSLFHRALIGDITATELHRSIEGVILPEFQRVSTQLRMLQKSLLEPAVEVEHPKNGHPAPQTTAEAPAGSADKAQQTTSTALALWIARLHDLEREHYTVTVSLASQLVEHCTPNVCAVSESELAAVEATGKADTEKEKVDTLKRTCDSTDIKSLFKPDSSDDDEQYDLVERHPKFIAHNSPDPSAAAPTLRVHDAERCTLLRLMPQRYHAHLYFVACRGAVDDLDGSPDHSANENDDVDNTDRSNGCAGAELVALHAKGVHRDGAPTIAHYAPSAVTRRCVSWSSAVAAVIHRQELLRAAIEDLCEELQGEISDGG